MPFSRTWKVLGKRGFSEWHGNVLNFCFGKYTVHVFVLPFVIQNIIHQKNCKIYFFIILEFSNGNENEFHGFGNLVIWLWKIFESILERSFKKPRLKLRNAGVIVEQEGQKFREGHLHWLWRQNLNLRVTVHKHMPPTIVAFRRKSWNSEDKKRSSRIEERMQEENVKKLN